MFVEKAQIFLKYWARYRALYINT